MIAEVVTDYRRCHAKRRIDELVAMQNAKVPQGVSMTWAGVNRVLIYSKNLRRDITVETGLWKPPASAVAMARIAAVVMILGAVLSVATIGFVPRGPAFAWWKVVLGLTPGIACWAVAYRLMADAIDHCTHMLETDAKFRELMGEPL